MNTIQETEHEIRKYLNELEKSANIIKFDWVVAFLIIEKWIRNYSFYCS